MRIHVIQTGAVAIKQVQRSGRPTGNPVLNILLDPHWTKPLPIFAFVIEHPQGLIVVDTGETARVAEPGYFPGGTPISASGYGNGYSHRRKSARRCAPWGSNPTTCAGCC